MIEDGRISNNTCKECGRFEGHYHHPLCKEASDEELAILGRFYYKTWLGMEEKHRAHTNQLYRRIEALKDEVTLWKGKHLIVCEENNTLRRKAKEVN